MISIFSMKRLLITTVVAVSFILLSSFSLQQTGLKTSMARGKKVYEMYCMACHQEDGTGVPRMNPPLTKTKWVTGDKKQLITIALKGLKGGEIEIDGDKYHNPMAAHDFLKDQEIADVLTYIRNSFGNKATLISTAEVKTVRAKLK
jgi:mono/diheme cytochrome c family protein